MEKIKIITDTYSIFESDNECANEVAKFIVEENYGHHSSHCFSDKDKIMNDEIASVFEEERKRPNSMFFLARTHQGKLIGSIRVFKWNKIDVLPIEQLFSINPLETIGMGNNYSYWHIGRFAIKQDAGFPTLTLFKKLMALAIYPIVHDDHGYMIAETDCKLLRIMNILGIRTKVLGEPINHLASMTVPVYSSKSDLIPYYNRIMSETATV